MKLKHQLFQRLQPFSHHYGRMRYVALLQLIITLVLPVVIKDLSTVNWLLSFALFAMFVASYALLRIAHEYQSQRRGLRGWWRGVIENSVLVIWLALAVLMIIGVIKLLLYALFN